MSNKYVFEYEEKHHFLTVDGVDYEIPQRTPALEEKIKEHDKKLTELTEYESNMSLLAILFGEENARQMFPDEKNTNLDKLAKCVKFSIALFMAEINQIKAEKTAETLKELEPMLKTIEKIGNVKTDIVALQRAQKKK